MHSHAEREERSDHGFGPGLRLRLIQATSSQTGSNVAGAAPRRVDDASSVHRSAIAMVDEKSVIHPTAASALGQPLAGRAVL